MAKPNFTFLIFVTSCLSPSSYASLSDDWQRQVDASREGVNKILDHILEGDGKNRTYDRLALLGDLFGSRMSGSESLENAINYTLANLTEENFTNVHGETLMVPRWTRGAEQGTLHIPALMGAPARDQPMYIMAVGTSYGTEGQNLTGQTIVVNSKEELEEVNKTGKAQGKIVVFNQPWESYGQSGMYRRMGGAWAESCGAIAALVRSVTGRSIYSPHTGVQDWDVVWPKIPVACITVEDAALLWRFQNRGHPLNVTIYMEAKNHNQSESRNVVAEWRGTSFPNQTVIFGGHIDTWDVTDGSMDDGGGVMLAWEALSLLKTLGLQPKRTLRLVLWTAEEYGLIGGVEYFKQHQQDELNKTSLIMQADRGTFLPYGINFDGSGLARSIMEAILQPLERINATTVVNGGGASSDTGEWVRAGVPGVELFSGNENYFDYHHTYGDAMTALDADQLDRCTAVWATVIYSVANMDDMLPRQGEYVGRASDAGNSLFLVSFITAITAIYINSQK